jgi:hypothetical protein
MPADPDQPPRRLVTCDVARRLGCSDELVRQLVASGKLAAEIVGEIRPMLTFDPAVVERVALDRQVQAARRDGERAARAAAPARFISSRELHRQVASAGDRTNRDE